MGRLACPHPALSGHGSPGGADPERTGRRVTFRVLGIDPGSQVTGYGVIEKARSGFGHVLYGEIKPGRGASLSQCLQT
ncbi:MAG: crossover junction endodeoxyribonuclease RuvC, partial [Thermodesulfobacteriota bacterium]